MSKVLIYYSQQSYGGVDTHLATLINNWPSKKDDFYILTNKNNSGIEFLKRKINRRNYNLIETRSLYKFGKVKSKFIKGSIWIFDNIVFIFEFLIKLYKIKPDIIIGNNGGYPGGITCFTSTIISKIFFPKKKVFLLIHHSPDNIYSKLSRLADRLVIICKLLKINFITVSNASANILIEKTPIRKIKVIYNGVDIINIKPHPNKLRKRFYISKKLFLIGMIGPVDSHKGHKTLIDVFIRSNYIRELAHFVIVGRGEETFVDNLKKYVMEHKISKNITFTGFLKENSIDIISEFDLLAMPTSDFEGFGYSMAEAMSVNVPIIASNVGAIPEIINHKNNGILVEPENLIKWTKNIELLIQSDELRKKMSLNGYQTIKKKFSSIKMSTDYHNFILKQ